MAKRDISYWSAGPVSIVVIIIIIIDNIHGIISVIPNATVAELITTLLLCWLLTHNTMVYVRWFWLYLCAGNLRLSYVRSLFLTTACPMLYWLPINTVPNPYTHSIELFKIYIVVICQWNDYLSKLENSSYQDFTQFVKLAERTQWVKSNSG
jgi:hypothetical protein